MCLSKYILKKNDKRVLKLIDKRIKTTNYIDCHRVGAIKFLSFNTKLQIFLPETDKERLIRETMWLFCNHIRH